MKLVLFQRILLDRQVSNQVLHHAIIWKTSNSGYMVAVSWALNKGDWWKDKAEKVAKFFSWNWKKKSNEFVRTGVYIGRLAIVWQTRPKGIKATESPNEVEAVYELEHSK